MLDFNDMKKQVLDAIKDEGSYPDEILRKSRMTRTYFNAVLNALDNEGKIKFDGQVWKLVKTE
jgi:predicted Rossmann fold nucleotide-binding protein DprA/Smf involved in DNA uptake